MRAILGKIGAFCEHHVEKMVFVVVGLVCIWLLFTRAIFSPNVVTVEKKNLSPSAIDPFIQQRAIELENMIKQPALSKRVYVAKLNGPVGPNDSVRVGVWGDLNKGYLGLLNSAIEGINGNISLPMPMYAMGVIGLKREYRLPTVGQVTDVGIDHIRAVVYLPTDLVTENMPYDKVGHEPNDIDLVTVEAKFDVAGLYRRFYSYFAGEDVREEAWRDPCLARPIFAAVQLQRQALLPDGGWSNWQDVPRSNIDHRKRLFQIIEKVEDLPPGGIKVRMLQYNDRRVTMDLLQPVAYQIASAKDEWFPPMLHRKFLDLQKKEGMEAKKEEADKQKEQDTRSTTSRDQSQGREARRGILRDRGAAGAGAAGGGYEGYGPTENPLYGTGEQGRTRSRTDRTGTGTGTRTQEGATTDRSRGRSTVQRTRTRTEPEADYLAPDATRDAKLKPSTADVYDEFDQVTITEMTDISKLREHLLFWANDDTVEPGNIYRYRIRLGVLNPVAGTNQVAKQDEQLKDQVILWSDFSGATDSIAIPRILYFFATGLQETAKEVTVEVSKYALGYWRSEEFAVQPGEIIGKVVETEPADPKKNPGGYRAGTGYRPGGTTGTTSRLPSSTTRYQPTPMYGQTTVEGGVPTPETVDYRTGAVLVDLVAASDWRGDKALHFRPYYDALYTLDGSTIEHMSVKRENWPKELTTAWQAIKNSQREPQEPLRAWNTKPRGLTRSRRDTLEGGGMGAYEEMFRPTDGGRPY